MNVNQFAVYQLKNIPENRQMRFRTYSALQEKGIQIQCKDYEQVYLGRMQPEDGPEQIRKRFERKLPRSFHGHSISVSDVLVLNKAGVVTSYYVEKEEFTVIAGFIRYGSSSAPLSFDTTHFHIEGKEGNWLAFDSIIIDGGQFFLMEHETYGKDAAWVVLDEDGKLIVDNAYHGFSQTVLQQIKEYLDPVQNVTRLQVQELPSGNSKEKQPLEFASAGSTFKRPEGYFAGKLIMEAGLRGYGVGGARVSEKHCGFIINKGGATAADVRQLMKKVQDRVKEQSGVELEPEIICLE